MNKYSVKGFLPQLSNDGKDQYRTFTYHTFAKDLTWQEAKAFRKTVFGSTIVRQPIKIRKTRKVKNVSKPK